MKLRISSLRTSLRTTILKSTAALALNLILSFAPVAALAASSQTVSLSPAQPNLSLSLQGTRSQTLYRTEIYDTTCTRTETYTDIQTQCQPQYQTQCTPVPPNCQNQCQDVLRPICNSAGCVNVPTHECKQVCTPSAPSCYDIRIQDLCRQVPVLRTRDVQYSCQQSRQVPNGTALVEDRTSNIAIALSGDVSSLSGQDALSVSVPNGVDVSDSGIRLALSHDAGSHLLYSEKLSDDLRSIGDRRSQETASFRLTAVEKEKVRGPDVKIESVSSDTGAIQFTISGAPIDASMVLHLEILKDQSFGGWKHLVNTDLAQNALRIVDLGGGRSQATLPLSAIGFSYNKRPHRILVSFVRDLAPSLSKNLLNPSILSGLNVRTQGSLQQDVRFK